MPLYIVRNDITKMDCDIIVNAANRTLMGGGGVDGAIHRAAGSELKEYCMTLGGCKTGEAKITPAFNLNCKYIIHTVGPVWKGGIFSEEKLLRSCYKNCLALAKENGAESIAFPLISSGVFSYPKKDALRIAKEEITSFLQSEDMTVYIVIFDEKSFEISKTLFNDVKEYIDRNYIQENYYNVPGLNKNYGSSKRSAMKESSADLEDFTYSMSAPMACCIPSETCDNSEISDIIKNIDESFSQMLLRKIDEKGITDAECYKKANIDRKLFSKIRNNINYKPKKAPVIAFAIALEMDIEETKDFLMKAGYALSHSDKFDLIIEYFITHNVYNVFLINETLFAFDQILIGV